MNQEETPQLGAALADGETEFVDVVLAVRPNAEHRQGRAAERVRNGPARQQKPMRRAEARRLPIADPGL